MIIDMVPNMEIVMSNDDFYTVYVAIQNFNSMGEFSDVDEALTLLEDAQEVMERYLSPVDPS